MSNWAFCHLKTELGKWKVKLKLQKAGLEAIGSERW